MAAITPAERRAAGGIVSYYGTSAANQADTLTTTAVVKHKAQKFLYASAVYSGSPTQAGVTVTKDSGLGAGYDAVLLTGSANVATTVLVSQTDLWLLPGDALVVSVPAGGSGQTVGIEIVLQET